VKRVVPWAICVLAVIPSGCRHNIGPRAMVRDRYQYAAAVSYSWKEQNLLNIVKVRYLDPPVFVDVGNIVTSYSLALGANANAGIGTVVAGAGAGSIGVLGTYTNTPTITYTPLTGNKFVRGLVTPLPPEALFTSIQSGAPADVVMSAVLESINGLRNQEATWNGIVPADPNFHRVRTLVAEIQRFGAMRISVKKELNQESTFLSFRTEDIPPEAHADIIELLRLLKLNQSANEFQVVSGFVSGNDTQVAVVTRSILGLMHTMAAEVEVPPEDLQRSFTFPGIERQQGAAKFMRLVRIHSGKSSPENAFVVVKYHDSWFWIDDNDLESKRVFSLMMLFFTMVDTEDKEGKPVVTIPAR
jgi:hypothetical protein